MQSKTTTETDDEDDEKKKTKTFILVFTKQGEEGRSDSSDKSDDPIGASGGKGTPNTPKGHEMRSALAAKSFEDSESVSTEADLDDSDIFEKKWNIDTDPWQSLLIPPEPDAALYNEFEGKHPFSFRSAPRPFFF